MTRQFVSAINTEAKENNCGVILISHSTKSARAGKDKTGSFAGSAAWSDSVRSAIVIEPYFKDDKRKFELEDVKIVSSYKNNYGKGFAYHIQKDYLDVEEQDWCGFKTYVEPETESKAETTQQEKARKEFGNGEDWNE